ncbi:hypothetical protein O9K51_01442 [Purpureocillium lavendulum]|uniref:Uncharacterized protein n=1 Tax=Purpureocillium lavendulum TaxID=1247861 RepID=A0AB34G588_9HYPO|nr:hypothetical protein O9K51_01442 [Purpureocillium lavendulum]
MSDIQQQWGAQYLMMGINAEVKSKYRRSVRAATGARQRVAMGARGGRSIMANEFSG